MLLQKHSNVSVMGGLVAAAKSALFSFARGLLIESNSESEHSHTHSGILFRIMSFFMFSRIVAVSTDDQDVDVRIAAILAKETKPKYCLSDPSRYNIFDD